MVLEKGVFDRIDGRHVGILDQDCVEKSSRVTFGAFQLLGNEHGLFGEIRVDGHRLSTDCGSTYGRVGIVLSNVKGLQTHRTRVPAVPGGFVARHDRDRGCVVYWRRAGRRVPARRFGSPGGSGPR